ncbi:uncharacterized protein LOC135486306 [Lineus longissimus]|uniref:uncharacterized protein LOC135486306 n=1 Tax=Lineus longissimus TaxID=88925 RepID=UPI002B4EF60D
MHKSSVWPEDVTPRNGALTVQLPDEHGEVGDSNVMYKLIPVTENDLDVEKITYTRVGFAHFRVMAISIGLLVFSLISIASGAVLFVYGPSAIVDYATAFNGGLFFLLTGAVGITASAKLKDCPIAGMMVLSVLGALSGAGMIALGAYALTFELLGILTAVNATISLAAHSIEIVSGLIGMILCLALSGMSCRAICCGERHFTVTVTPGRKEAPRVQVLPVPMGYPMASYVPGLSRSVEMSYSSRHSPELVKGPISNPVGESLQHKTLDGVSLPGQIVKDNAQQQANLKRWKLNKGLLKTVNVLYGMNNVNQA